MYMSCPVVLVIISVRATIHCYVGENCFLFIIYDIIVSSGVLDVPRSILFGKLGTRYASASQLGRRGILLNAHLNIPVCVCLSLLLKGPCTSTLSCCLLYFTTSRHGIVSRPPILHGGHPVVSHRGAGEAPPPSQRTSYLTRLTLFIMD